MMGGRYYGRILLCCIYMIRAYLHAKCRIDVINVNCMRMPQRFPSAWS
jgi:hypothetical protein